MHNTVAAIILQRKHQAYKNKLALGKMVDYSFSDAMDMCHWLGLNVRPIGVEWYLTASKIGHRYAIRKNTGEEYVTSVQDLSTRWEVVE